MGQAVLGNDTVFKIGDKTTGVAVANLTEVNGVEMSRSAIETTVLDDKWKTFTGGKLDAGEISLSGYFLSTDTTGQLALKTNFEAGTVDAYAIVFPTSITADYSITAVITKLKIGDFTEDGQIVFEASLKVSGQPVLTIA